MNSRNRQLALIAIACLTLYVLACRPAFSPDGSKILLTSVGGTNDQSQVLLYDRRSEKFSTVLTLSKQLGGDAAPVPAAVWSPEGNQIIVAWAVADERIMVNVLPSGSSGPARLFLVDGLEEALQTLVNPPPVLGSWLFLGGRSIAALNLETGEIVRDDLGLKDSKGGDKATIHLIAAPEDVYYAMSNSGTLEAGRVEMTPLRRLPLLQIKWPGDQAALFLAVSKLGGRMALITGKSDAQQLLIYRQLQLERTVPFGFDHGGLALGNLVWSPDGKTLYAAGFKAEEPGSEHVQMTLCEIPLEGRSKRETPLFRLKKGNDDAYLVTYQIALSPDGKTIAAFGGVAIGDDTVREEDRALYLIALSRPGQPVTKIPIRRPRG